ncbi:branched-chain amino acid ABC transporter permease [Verminephrobacter eiseniae]|uniref:branched-chain amino acid ABC transporter permease n=1 Tax=Verminephrobacter eiseniae TaxID=364317 RepID=UPI002244CDDD|nr:branched-chain amino acid ABC transporter permease [Verminephrobacter eiseniae]MCW8184646.1 branched-chain amino acid ABC transporter permease [Verminephrobacter eiseniae]MCW8223322.1 branched-chain amino acid ABC transporter permease [Verminephrobacter eiseniae]
MQKKTMAVLVLLALVAALPQVLQVKYFIHLAVLAMLWAMVAQGTNFIQGYAGYVSIVQGGFMGVGAYSSAWLSMNTGLPVWLAFVAAPLCTAVVALCVGYPSLRVKGHYFAIVTMAFNMVIFIFLVNAIGLTGGESGLGRIPAPPGFTLLGQEVDFQNRAHYYYLVLLALVCSSVLAAWLVRSRAGRIWQAIRQNEMYTEALGVATWRYKLLAFVASALYAGSAGALYAHYVGFINPTPFSVDASMNAILAVILGGSATLSGPMVGAVLVVALPEMLRIAETFRFIAYGVLLMLAVMYFPRGLVPMLAGWFRPGQ